MKRISVIWLLAIGIFLLGCQKQERPDDGILVQGTVVEINNFGSLVASFTPEELAAAGVDFGDLLKITIGEELVITAPYVDAYTQVGSMSPCLCNYNRGATLDVSISNGSFVICAGGKAGDRLVIGMSEKEGYLKEYNLLKGTYSSDRSEFASDEIFANFRELATTGLKPGVLYRSTSPINFKDNKVRYQYADALCRAKGIITVIDIADSDEKIREYLSAEETKGFYVQECLSKGNIIGLNSNMAFTDSAFQVKLAQAVRKIIASPGPYLIHCNEGKDRTGFYCLMFEALCGAPLAELKEDYMKTFENLYKQEKGTPKYELTWKKNGLRMLNMIANPHLWPHIITIDWDLIPIEEAGLAKAAENYLLLSGLTAEEIRALKGIIAPVQ